MLVQNHVGEPFNVGHLGVAVTQTKFCSKCAERSGIRRKPLQQFLVALNNCPVIGNGVDDLRNGCASPPERSKHVVCTGAGLKKLLHFWRKKSFFSRPRHKAVAGFSLSVTIHHGAIEPGMSAVLKNDEALEARQVIVQEGQLARCLGHYTLGLFAKKSRDKRQNRGFSGPVYTTQVRSFTAVDFDGSSLHLLKGVVQDDAFQSVAYSLARQTDFLVTTGGFEYPQYTVNSSRTKPPVWGSSVSKSVRSGGRGWKRVQRLLNSAVALWLH